MMAMDDMISDYLDSSGDGAYSPRAIRDVSFGSGLVMFLEIDQDTNYNHKHHMIPVMEFFLWLHSRIEE